MLTLAALVYGLIESSTLGWGSPLIIGALVIAVAAAAGFVASQRRAASRGRQPLMPLELWRSGRFVGANLSALAYFIMLYGILYFYSIDLQQYQHYSTLGAGLAFLPMTILMAVLGPVAGRLSARFSTTPVMVAGLLLAAAGALSLALLPAGGSALELGWRFALIGLGAGLMNSPMSNSAVSERRRPPQRGRVRHPQHVPADRRHPRGGRARHHRRRRAPRPGGRGGVPRRPRPRLHRGRRAARPLRDHRRRPRPGREPTPGQA